MHNKPVSILMVSFNHANYIAGAIESVLAQDYNNWELVIFDDGSLDDTLRIAGYYQDKYPDKIRTIAHPGNENKGIHEAYRSGINECRSDLIAFLEADDVWHAQNLAAKIALLMRYPDAGLVYSAVTPIGDPCIIRTKINYLKEAERISKAGPFNAQTECFYMNPIPSFSTVVLRRRLLEGLELIQDTRYCVWLDWFIWIQLSFRTKFLFIPKRLVKWRLYAKSHYHQFLSQRGKFRIKIFETRYRLMALRRILSLAKGLNVNPCLAALLSACGFAKRIAKYIIDAVKQRAVPKRKLDFCIFFVTSKCNSCCRHCFYKDKLNKDNDLSLSEVQRIFFGIGYCPLVLLSGGEPFLRQDLPEIVKVILNTAKPRILAIPTNGIEKDSVMRTVLLMLNDIENSDTLLSINVSIDAFEETGAIVRGRKDAFTAALDTIAGLGELKKTHNNLRIFVNSVFSPDTQKEAIPLVDFISKLDYVDFHAIEVMRPVSLGGYRDMAIDVALLKQAQISAVFIHAKRLRKKIYEAKQARQRIREVLRYIAWIGHIRYSQAVKESFLERKRPVFKCPAGSDISVIDSDGEVRICELSPPIGNLRDVGYDIYTLLCLERPVPHCLCTHACFIDEYIRLGLAKGDPRVVFMVIYHFLKFLFCALSQKNKAKG
jgi:glycosyltransferase involved in cell wall biosynthesis